MTKVFARLISLEFMRMKYLEIRNINLANIRRSSKKTAHQNQYARLTFVNENF